MSTGELLTRWTVRLALLLYAMTLALRIAQPHRNAAARLLWTAGCGLFLAHVVYAFHFFHGWSHQHAYDETARQTRAVTGVDSGDGLYLNYLFTLVWAADVAMWWLGGQEAYERRPRWVDVTLHVFMAFMVVNGAVVFASGATRWSAVVVAVALAALLATKWLAIDRLNPSDS